MQELGAFFMISSLKNFHIDLSIVAPIFIVLILVAAIFTVIIYRRTNPIISTILKSMLIVLRAAALVLLLLVLFEATVQLFFEKKNAPILAVAVDNSASMTIKDNSGSRAGQVKNILQNDIFPSFNKKFDVKYYSFSNTTVPLANVINDSLQFIGDATNIQETLESIKVDNVSQNLSAILLISDGVYNAGGNPIRTAEALGVPVHSIAVGSAEPITDLAITEVVANPFCYVDQSTPIRLKIHNSGFSKITLPVSLQSNGTTIVAETTTIPDSPSDKEIILDFTPTETGRQKLVLSIPAQADEQTLENNQRTLYIDVFKSKLKIVLIAASLSPDISFLKRLLTTDRYQVATIIQKRAGEFYKRDPAADLENADMFIFYDFPTNDSGADFTDELFQILEKNRQPILFISGKRISWAKLEKFSNYSPVASATRLPREQLVFAQLSPLGETHPVMQVATEAALARSLWSELPPVFTSFSAQQLAAGATVLAYSRPSANSRQLSPLIILGTNGAHKSAALMAHELWRWDLMMWGINRSEDVYRTLLINLARWLETNKSEDLVRVEMEKTNYSYGDAVNMRISVFDENLNPVSDAEVAIQLEKGEWRREYSALSIGDGKYSFLIQPPIPGDYEALVSASQGERKIGDHVSLFSVGEYSAELADLQAQPAVLRGLSRATGGFFTSPDSVNLLAEHVHGAATVTPVTRENELWNNRIILALILVLLTSEWFIRKRKGMV